MNEARDARLAALGFDVERQRRARRYKRQRAALTVLRVLVSLVVAVALLRGLTFDLKAWSSAVGAGPAQVAAYAVLLVLLFWLPVLPLGAYGGLVLERRFGMSVQGLRSWLADAAKGLALGLLFAVLAVEVVYFLLSAAPDVWWLYAWAFFVLVEVFLTWISPVVLAPLFHRYEPFTDEALASRLRALAERAGTKVVGVFRMAASVKTTRAFGGLTGVGRTRRIVLSDTLLARHTPDEVEAVVAHEVAHHANRDIPYLLAWGAAASFVALFAVDRILRAAVPALALDGIADIAGLPLLVLALAAVSSVFSPVLNAWSRRREAHADAFALRVTANRDALRNALVKIHDQNLGVADPHPLVEALLHDHPSGRRRVEAALRWRSS